LSEAAEEEDGDQYNDKGVEEHEDIANDEQQEHREAPTAVALVHALLELGVVAFGLAPPLVVDEVPVDLPTEVKNFEANGDQGSQLGACSVGDPVLYVQSVDSLVQIVLADLDDADDHVHDHPGLHGEGVLRGNAELVTIVEGSHHEEQYAHDVAVNRHAPISV